MVREEVFKTKLLITRPCFFEHGCRFFHTRELACAPFLYFFFFVVLLIPIIYHQPPFIAPNPHNAAECVDATADELTFCTINYMTTESTAGKEEKVTRVGGSGAGWKLGINGDRVSTLVGLVDLPGCYRHLELLTHLFLLLRVDQPETFNGTLFSDPSFEDRDNAAANLASTCTFAVHQNVLGGAPCRGRGRVKRALPVCFDSGSSQRRYR